MARIRSVLILLAGLAAVTFGSMAVLVSSPAGAYAPVIPVASTSTTAGPTTTVASGSTSGNQNNTGNNGNNGNNNGNGGGVVPPAPSGLANAGAGATPTGNTTAASGLSTGSTLPFTGADILGLVLLALVLLAIGLLARAAGRRRQPA